MDREIGRKNPLFRDIHTLVFRPRDYVRVAGQKELTSLMEIKLLVDAGRLSWIIHVSIP